MAKKTIYICDRCGQEFMKYGQDRAVGEICLAFHACEYSFADLCLECQVLLKDWMMEPSNKEKA